MHVIPFFVGFALALAVPRAAAQSGLRSASAEPDGVLHPVTRVSWDAGLRGGVSYNLTAGTFTSTCNCSYPDGSGMAAAVDIFFEYRVGRIFSIRAWSGFRDRSIEMTARDSRMEYERSSGSYVRADVERRVSIGVPAFALGLDVLTGTGIPDLRVFAGIGVLFPVEPSLHETEVMLSPGLVFASTGTREAVVHDGVVRDIARTTDMLSEATAGLQYEIDLSTEWRLVPEFSVSFPVSPLLPSQSGWRTSSVALTVHLSTNLN